MVTFADLRPPDPLPPHRPCDWCGVPEHSLVWWLSNWGWADLALAAASSCLPPATRVRLDADGLCQRCARGLP